MPFDTAANDNLMLAERRVHARRKVLLTGRLAYADTSLTAACVIRNLSARGAMVTVPDVPMPHDPFLIVIKQAFLHEARTVWQGGERWGLAFLTSWRLTDPAGGVAPLRQLWLELLPR